MSRGPGGRRVLITGGASGLGAALASRYAQRGDRVLVTDLAAEAEVPTGALYQRLDITSPSEWAGALERVRLDLGGLDVLVNNAGIAAGGRVDRLDDAHWRRVLDVNVLGAVNGCRTFAPLLKTQGHGHVVNVASLAGLVHPAAMSSYDASKAAVVALSESLRHELGPWGVDVTVVCPSFFRTNLAASLGGEDPLMDEVAAKLISRAPLGAEEIAARVLKGVDARRFLVLPDRSARLAYWTKRLARPLYDRRMLASGAKIRQAELREKAPV
ncbi:SDR family NAD(P)-dependent oxidoreductase [Streptomyces sp. NBC_00203]|uniref:SDR family NAD(P)-dependent oxidoreductase n=1 Tax=Streptomyces sp. NBC_00203 TaxID=2975680 RepID=UPI00324CFE35